MREGNGGGDDIIYEKILGNGRKKIGYKKVVPYTIKTESLYVSVLF